MARKDRGYVNAFAVNEAEETKVNNEKDKEQEIVTEPVQQPIKKTEQVHVMKTTDGERIDSDLEDLKNFGKKKVEDTHTRQTWLIENNLLKEFEKHCKGKGKGYKTRFVNAAIRKLLADLAE